MPRPTRCIPVAHRPLSPGLVISFSELGSLQCLCLLLLWLYQWHRRLLVMMTVMVTPQEAPADDNSQAASSISHTALQPHCSLSICILLFFQYFTKQWKPSLSEVISSHLKTDNNIYLLELSWWIWDYPWKMSHPRHGPSWEWVSSVSV